MNAKSPVQRWAVQGKGRRGPATYTLRRDPHERWSATAEGSTAPTGSTWATIAGAVSEVSWENEARPEEAKRVPLDVGAKWPRQWEEVQAEGPPVKRRPLLVYGAPDPTAEFLSAVMDACEADRPGLRTFCLSLGSYASSESRSPEDCFRALLADMFYDAGIPGGKAIVDAQPWGLRPGCTLRLMERYLFNHPGPTLWVLPDVWRLKGNRTYAALADLLDDCTQEGYGGPWGRFMVAVGSGEVRDPNEESCLWRNFSAVVLEDRACSVVAP